MDLRREVNEFVNTGRSLMVRLRTLPDGTNVFRRCFLLNIEDFAALMSPSVTFMLPHNSVALRSRGGTHLGAGQFPQSVIKTFRSNSVPIGLIHLFASW